jgi:hypothetical protein
VCVRERVSFARIDFDDVRGAKRQTLKPRFSVSEPTASPSQIETLYLKVPKDGAKRRKVCPRNSLTQLGKVEFLRWPKGGRRCSPQWQKWEIVTGRITPTIA